MKFIALAAITTVTSAKISDSLQMLLALDEELSQMEQF
jgi:hypothetical protein